MKIFEQQTMMRSRILFSGFLIFTLLLSFVAVPFPALAQQGSDNANRYIVVLNEGISPRDIVRENGFVPEFVYEHAVNGFAGPISPKMIEKLSDDPRVKYVEKDQKVYAFAQTVPTGVKRINDAPYTSPGTINGVTVAILDTGIDLDHPDLNVNTQYSVNCSGGGPFNGNCKVGGEDGYGHGSHVAGTVGAKDNGIGVIGVAPGVELWAVKVLDDRGSGYMSKIVAGIDYVRQNADLVDVANMSLGCECSSPTMDAAITSAVNAGVTFVVAAGNEMSNASTFSPANHPLVLTVSAIADFDGVGGGSTDKIVSFSICTENADDSFACFSNFGNTVELAAPGVSIYSTYKNGGYATFSGTSMASPHVAGAVALYIAENGRDVNNDVNVDELDVEIIIQALQDNGKLQTDTDYGYDSEGKGFEPVVYLSSGPSVIPTLESISISPLISSVDVGATLQYTATGHYNVGGDADITNDVAWSSTSGTGIATIDSNGLATGVSDGQVTITATLNAFTPSTGLTINPEPTLTGITISPLISSVDVGATLQYTATGHYNVGGDADITNDVAWSSTSGTGIATIDSNGLATGVSDGQVTITATLNAFAPNTSLTVNVAPETPTSTEATVSYFTEGGKDADKHLYANITFDPIVVGASATFTVYLDGGFFASSTTTIGESGTIGYTIKNASVGVYTTDLAVMLNDKSLVVNTIDGNSDLGFDKTT